VDTAAAEAAAVMAVAEVAVATVEEEIPVAVVVTVKIIDLFKYRITLNPFRSERDFFCSKKTNSVPFIFCSEQINSLLFYFGQKKG
jgi:hypothetical protein